jgi:Fe(II)/alpha-ketoglutarate-dependent arginine beta-hydroxylase
MSRYVLNDADRERVRELAGHFSEHYQTLDASKAMASIQEAAQQLPDGIRTFLASARSKESPVFYLSGLPVSGNLALTPNDWQSSATGSAGGIEEVILLMCAALLGDPFGWVSQQRGRLVQDVLPVKGKEQSLTNSSSRAELKLHTEDVYHPRRCDYVGLLCLRNPDAVGTTVSSVRTLTIPEHTRSILRENRFRFFPDDSHAESYEHSGGIPNLSERNFEEGPILLGSAQAPYLRIDPDFTTAHPDDVEADAALRELSESLMNAATREVVRPGELVFLDNYQVVHGRDPFTPRYDGYDRWLKRVNIIRDIRRAYIAEKTTSPVFAAQIDAA